ncbi:MAG: NAD-dependent epimerase/dehydratase family protein, partial [Verrucomicrobiae bacterium]|nr:NAD-dependent epimerase/dehydratase family protein [Verrucomicrobiae bacterium]
MKIFLTGASGLLGNALANAFLTQDWEVHVTTHQRAARIGGLQVHPLDLTDTASLRNLISTLQPEAIVN